MTITKTILLLAFVLTNTLAFSQQCENGTNTNPLSPSPVNSGYQTNSFDWRAPQWQPYLNSTTIIGPTQYVSPFVQFDPYLNAVAHGLLTSDNSPDDGWELVKQNFGYYAGTNTGTNAWQQGGILANPLDPNNPSKGAFDNWGYFILYNKYSGLMRVFCYAPEVNQVQDKVYIRLQFIQKNDAGIGSYPNFNINGLFNHYTTRTLPLDKHTQVTDIGAAAAYPGHTDLKFFYADFQLAYDPCVCLFEEPAGTPSQYGLHVYLELINTANITMSGKFAGTTNYQLENITNSSGHAWGDGTNNTENFITSVFDNGGSPESVMQSYSGAAGAGADASSNNTNLQDAFTAVGPIIDEVVGIWSGDYAGVIKGFYDATSTSVNYFSSQTNKDGSGVKRTPMLTSGYLNLAGTITTQALSNARDAYIAMPGSANNNQTEYEWKSGNSAVPSHPTYNEPLGTFALLKTPVVNEYRYLAPLAPYQSNRKAPQTFAFGTNYSQPPHGETTFQYNPAEDLVYTLNPVFDANKTKIYVSYEIDGMPTNDPHHPDKLINHSVFSLEYIEDRDYGVTDPTYGKQSFMRYKTKRVLLSCNKQLFTHETFDFEVLDNYDFGDLYDSNWEAYETSIDPNGGYERVNSPRKVVLVVMLDLVSKPDANGKIHTSIQIIKYDCNVHSVAAPIITMSNLNSFLTLSGTYSNNNQVLNTQSYTFPNTIDFSHGTMQIIGDQTNSITSPLNSPVNLLAETEIQVNGEVHINALDGPITLSLSDFPTYYSVVAGCNSPVTPLDNSSIVNYCKNSSTYSGNQGYQANVVASRLSNGKVKVNRKASNSSFVNSKILGEDVRTSIYPNPSTGLININVSAPNSGTIYIYINDVDGKNILSSVYNSEKGANNFKINLSDLISGVYIINIKDADGFIIKADKVVIMK